MSVDSLLSTPKSESPLDLTYDSILQGVGNQPDILALSAAAATLPDSLDLSPHDLDLNVPVAMDTTPGVGPTISSSSLLDNDLKMTSVLDPKAEPLSPPGLVPAAALSSAGNITQIVTLTTKPSTMTSPVIVTQSPQQTVVKVTDATKVNPKAKFQPKPVPPIKPKMGLPSSGW